MSDSTAASLFDRLVEADILRERGETVHRTADFESTMEILRATYTEGSEAAFHDAVAETFGISPEAASTKVATYDVDREELVALKALQHHLGDADADTLLQMVGMVTAAGPTSPVPDGMATLPDQFAPQPGWDGVVFVFKRDCAPCERLHEVLDELREAVPDDVEFLGVDGPEHPAFLERYEVSAAPTALLFRDGELRDRLEGYRSPAAFQEMFDEQY